MKRGRGGRHVKLRRLRGAHSFYFHEQIGGAMRGFVERFVLAAGLSLTAAGNAAADVAPDPTDPTGPVGIAVIAVLVLAAGYILYRRLRK